MKKKLREQHSNHKEITLLSMMEPKNVVEDSKDQYWVDDMNEELDQIEKCETWELAPRPKKKMLSTLNGFLEIT